VTPSSQNDLSSRRFYDEAYATENYFRHRQWLYRAYVRSLVGLAGLRPGASLLDVGCGQGLFSHLFAKEGLRVCGTDISAVGLKTAKRLYGDSCQWFATDVGAPATTKTFDGVFTRSCSLHNTTSAQHFATVNEQLLQLVRPGGVLLIAYNTSLAGSGGAWRHHRLEDLRRLLDDTHASMQLFFVNRIDTIVFGRFAFNRAFTRINQLLAERTALGGEAVALLRRHAEPNVGKAT
jgi:SAM-dependent methyltransferase